MKHIKMLTNQSHPSMAASSLIVKETYIGLWSDMIAFASDAIAFIRDVTGGGE
ncbi:MAG: hypothetical protein AAB353_04765 [Candidatus Hydrogenedentota bacterium]